MKLTRSALAGLALLALMAGCGDGATDPPTEQNAGHVFTYKVPAGAPALTSVNVAGSFNEWSTTAVPMTKQADGTWKATLKLNPGSYQYKYVMNGNTWVQSMCSDATWGDPANGGKVDPAVTSCVDDGFGGQNGVLVVK